MLSQLSVAHSSKTSFSIVFAIALAALFALVGGGILALFGPIFGALLLMLAVGVGLVFFKKILLYFCVFMALFVTGLTQLYYPPLSFLRWIIPIAASLLVFHIVFARIDTAARDSLPFPWLFRWALLFAAVAVVGAAAHWQGSLNLIQGIKLYFQLWGVLFGLAFIKWQPKTLDNLLKALFVLALIQLPFVLHQYFFIVPEREGLWQLGIVPVDVVAGTFGADRFGSGRNAVLSMFLVAVIGVLAALWRAKALKGHVLLLAAPILLAPLFLNESKFAPILLLLSLGYIFRADILKNPLRFMVASLAAAALAIGLLASYSLSFGKGKTIVETIEVSVRSNVGSQGYAGRVLNRWTALTFWVERHGLQDLPGTLIGHGLGASHESSGSALSSTKNLADTRYRGYGIGLTGLSALLWDTGLLGTFTILAMFGSSFMMAGKLARSYASNPSRYGIFTGMQVAILSSGLMLLHSNYFVLDAVFQTLVYFMFGYVAYWTIRDSGPVAIIKP